MPRRAKAVGVIQASRECDLRVVSYIYCLDYLTRLLSACRDRPERIPAYHDGQQVTGCEAGLNLVSLRCSLYITYQTMCLATPRIAL